MEYDKCRYPNFKEKKKITEEHELDEIKVNNWFNRSRNRKSNDIPRTDPGPSTSFQRDEHNYFDIQPSELEKQDNNQDERDLTFIMSTKFVFRR